MTRDVIDGAPSSACAGGMDAPVVPFRFDASLRVVIWTDAALSAALALLAVLSPVVIVLPLPSGATTGVGLAALAAALVLAGLGAVTAVLLMMRMRAGHGHAPPGLRLPLPAAMCPAPMLAAAPMTTTVRPSSSRRGGPARPPGLGPRVGPGGWHAGLGSRRWRSTGRTGPWRWPCRRSISGRAGTG